ncbi:MAG TPA: hypothetical protein VK436_06125 [Methanocella sp.]|nr:hypothetical protein [Methanocella sp.]
MSQIMQTMQNYFDLRANVVDQYGENRSFEEQLRRFETYLKNHKIPHSVSDVTLKNKMVVSRCW